MLFFLTASFHQSCPALGLKMPGEVYTVFVDQNILQSQGLSDLSPSQKKNKKTSNLTKNKFKKAQHGISLSTRSARSAKQASIQRGMNSITCHVVYTAGLWSPSSLPPQLACLSHARSVRQLWATPATFTREPAIERQMGTSTREKEGVHGNVLCLSACECLWWG